MIGFLTGTVLKILPTGIILDVGGVGYRVTCPVSLTALVAAGDALSLHIHTAVREDAIELYGFREEAELQAFEILISVSGVGPKMAVGLLSGLSVRELATAASDSGTRLQAAPGIGKKTAQRIALEVGEKLQELAMVAGADSAGEGAGALGDAIEGLVALGYNRTDARQAAQEAKKKLPETANAAAIIREALQGLSQAKA